MLKGQKVNLRLARESDLDDYIRLTQDVEAKGHYFPVDIRSASTIRKSFDEHGFWSDAFQTMLIVDPESDRMLGSVTAFKPVFYQDSLELGYILHDVSRRGQGLMSEAVRLFCGYLFEWKNIFRIQIQVEPGNLPSVLTAQKAGFTREGTLRQCLLARGVPTDMDIYSILRSEYPPT